MNWLSREAGQQRRQQLNNALAQAAQYYLGPTGIPQRLNALGILNPINDMEQASQNALAMVAPGATGRERFNAGVGMVTDMATAVAPAYAASRIGPDGAAAIVDSLTGIGAMQRQGMQDAGQRFAMDDAGGIRLFHGTNSEKFDAFDPSQFGRTTDAGDLGTGAYLSTDPTVGRSFQSTLEFDVDATRPLTLKYPKWGANKQKLVREALGLPDDAPQSAVDSALRDRGYDSVSLDYSPVGYDQQEWMIVDPSAARRIGGGAQ